MNKMTVSTFRKNGNDVLGAVPLCVISRKRPFLFVRPYYYVADRELPRLPWSIVAQRSAGNWRKFFKRQEERGKQLAQAVTLDGLPEFVVEQWSDESQQ